MSAVQSELSALNICLASLEEDARLHARVIPDQLVENVLAIIKNCGGLVCEIAALLTKMGSGSLARKAQWTAFGQADVARLRGHLEAHKSALNIALDIISQRVLHVFKSMVLIGVTRLREMCW